MIVEGPAHVAGATFDGYWPGSVRALLVDEHPLFRWGLRDLLERNGQKQTWIKAGTIISADRTIAAIAGNRVTVSVPLSDSYDAAYLNPPGASIVKYTFPGRIERVGV